MKQITDMKIFIAIHIFCWICCFVRSISGREDYQRAAREECQKKFGYSDDELLAGKTDLDSVKCYLHCFLKLVDAMDDSGHFYPEKAVMAIGPDIREQARPQIMKCHDDHKDYEDPCIHAQAIVSCFARDNEELYQILALFGKPG